MIKYALMEPSDVELTEEVYLLLSDYISAYPNLFNWYYRKVIPNLMKTRNIVIAYDTDMKRVVGYVITKMEAEKKISSLYVVKSYRRQGIGSTLLEWGMAIVKSRKPLITVNNHYLDYYLPLFGKLGYSLRYIYRDYYVKDHVEYCFNGSLSERKSAIVTKL